MKSDISVFRVFLLIGVIWLFRNPCRRYILKSEHFTNLKIVDMLLIIDLNFSNTLAFVFVAGEYGAIEPVNYFIQFFLAIFYYFLMVLFYMDFRFCLRFELVGLHEMREDVAGLEFLLVVLIKFLLIRFSLEMV